MPVTLRMRLVIDLMTLDPDSKLALDECDSSQVSSLREVHPLRIRLVIDLMTFDSDSLIKNVPNESVVTSHDSRLVSSLSYTNKCI